MAARHSSRSAPRPELFLALVGAVGTDLGLVTRILETELSRVGCTEREAWTESEDEGVLGLQLYREIQADKKNWPSWMHDHLKALREHQDRQRARKAAEQEHGVSGLDR